jgi:lauroyl/myristoyl acyltransferase
LRAPWTRALAHAKSTLGVEVVDPRTSPAALVRGLARALGRGAVVAVLVDGDVATARRSAALGGARCALPLGPARLAAKTGARLVAGRCERERAHAYHVRLVTLDDGLAARDEAARFERVRAWLAATLAEDPGRWCLFREFFDSEEAPPSARAQAVPAR